MRRRQPAARLRPMLKSDEVGMTAHLGDVAGDQECRALLVKMPEDWQFKGAEDQRLQGETETVTIGRRHPNGIPAGRYLRLPVDTLVDPWGRVSIALEFETPAGTQRAELTVQARAEETISPISEFDPSASDGVRLDARSIMDLSDDTSIFFVEGGAGDVLDLTEDPSGTWVAGDTDGAHTLYVRSERRGQHRITLAVRNGVEVKLASSGG